MGFWCVYCARDEPVAQHFKKLRGEYDGIVWRDKCGLLTTRRSYGKVTSDGAAATWQRIQVICGKDCEGDNFCRRPRRQRCITILYDHSSLSELLARHLICTSSYAFFTSPSRVSRRVHRRAQSSIR